MSTPPAPEAPQQPWWKYGHLWMVIGGPLVVVVASFVTLYLAIHTPDPVYTDAPGSSHSAGSEAHAYELAMQARNHAATGGVAPKASAAAEAVHP